MSKCADCNELVGEEWSANNGLCSTCARDELSEADTNQANELHELCKEVYERTEWQGDFLSNWGWVQAHGEYEVDNGCTDGLPPLYTSDYLLEKLQERYDIVLSNDERMWRAMNKQSQTLCEADTPLKALLKLTIALSEAGELNG